MIILFICYKYQNKIHDQKKQKRVELEFVGKLANLSKRRRKSLKTERSTINPVENTVKEEAKEVEEADCLVPKADIRIEETEPPISLPLPPLPPLPDKEKRPGKPLLKVKLKVKPVKEQ